MEKLLQGHNTCISPIMEVVSGTGGSVENLSNPPAQTAQVHGNPNLGPPPRLAPPTAKSVSPGSSLSSISPPVSPYDPQPPPSYEQHIERQHRHHPPPIINSSSNSSNTAVGQMRQSRQLDHSNLQQRLSELSVRPQVNAIGAGVVGPAHPHMDPAHQQLDPTQAGGVPTCTTIPPTTRGAPANSQQQTAGPTYPRAHIPYLPLTPDVGTDGGNGNRRGPLDSALDTPVSNPPLSPISETSSGVCNNLSGVNTRSVSAAVSDESVAGDSGVFEASIKR